MSTETMQVKEALVKYLASAEAQGVPLGYKWTEVGVIPENWAIKYLREVAAVTSGGTPSRTNARYWNGEIPWITTSEVDFHVIYSAEQRITKEGLKNSAATLLPRGTILLALYGQGKTRGKVGVLGIDAATNQACAAISVSREVSGDFLFYYLSSQYEAIRKLSNTGNQENLNSVIVRSVRVLLPTPTEQRAIAEALSDVDGLLGALEALIAKKRAIKQAAMQQLLTGKTRLPGFSGEWEIKRLKEVALIRNMKVAPSSVAPETLCVELEHISQGGGRLIEHSEALNSSSTKYRFYSGDVLFGRLRPYLRKYWLADRDGICTTEIWPLVVDEKQAFNRFLHAVVQAERFIEAASISYGTHMPRADWTVMQNFEVRLPSVDEQTAIATILSDMDAEIAALEARRDKTRALKQGMMQQLLTGRVRLVKPIVKKEVSA